MNQEKCNLTWHTYSDHLKSMMKDLMMNDDFSDVTLVTEDKKYLKANMSILSACSPVFKDIFKKERSSRSTMYLRGIQYSEMESIIRFIYLGEATYYEKRMDELLAVSKSLEIKGLCNARADTKEEPKDEPPNKDPVTSTENFKEQNISHKDIVHEDVKYACDQCDYQTTQQSSLKIHIQSKHKGYRYACDRCDYRAKKQSHLTTHTQSKHEGVKYACNQCDHQYTDQSSLSRHIKSKHDGVKCTQQGNLTQFIQSMHEGIKYASIKKEDLKTENFFE